MRQTIYLFVTSLSLLCVLPAASALTNADCGREYDKCKKDVAHIFNKKPCKKAMSKCQAEVAAAQHDGRDMRNEMRDGKPMRDEASKAAAKRRLREREMAKRDGDEPFEYQGGMRDQMANERNDRAMTPAERKAAAQRRLKSRQGTPSNGGSMRDDVKSN